MSGEEGESGDLKSRLTSSLGYFNDLLSVIPPRNYIAPKGNEIPPGKFMKNLNNKAPKQEIKERSKKAKRDRLDPTRSRRTVVDIQRDQQREEEEEEEELAKKRAKNNSNGAVEPIAEGAFLRQHVKQSTENLTIEEMKKRWREKLEALRAERHADQHKQKREKVTNKRKKLKEKRKAKSLVKGGVDAQGRPLASAKPGDQQKAPPVVFSKFEFANDNKKKKKSKPTPQQQLLKVEKEKEKLNKLKEANPEKANEVEESQAWKKALQRAEGGKVFDSEKLVKKKIKAVERKKTKSKKEWDERTSQVEKQKKERQEKRAKNLKARADAKKEKKMNKGKKKKSKPGFK
eukprot:m.180141 g.180141  ORF g.180141 m.180141 type:complete len:346 (-) comp13573_c2_seq4:81-1118(-)